jgi:uncharacterized protein (TIGR01777 family)
MRVTVSGATGLIGSRLVTRLRERGAEITVLSRDPERAQAKLAVPAVRWNPASEPAPSAAISGRDAIIHLAGENVAQRWSESAKRAIRDSRVDGTRQLLEGLRTLAEDTRPGVLVSSSAIGYYGSHGEEPLDEDSAPGSGFLAETCAEWEAESQRATELGMRVVQIRTGVVLDRDGGALAQMLRPFRLGVGGPIAGGAQYMSWIHPDDLIGLILAAIESEDWSGPLNATAPEPVSNREFSHVLGRALHRPAVIPIPALGLRALYGEMAEIVTGGARVLPAKALVLGFRFVHPHLPEALEDALG